MKVTGDGVTTGTGKGVEHIQNAYNVAPQHVLKDSELVPSVIKFATDGSDVLVIYEADRSEPFLFSGISGDMHKIAAFARLFWCYGLNSTILHYFQ